jgi:hypothetical protein
LKNGGTEPPTFLGNQCDTNENDTNQSSGTFAINGNRITFNEISNEVTGIGDVISTQISDLSILLEQKIIELTENELVIERKFNIVPIYRNCLFERT